MLALVTGATGFIGGRLCRELAARGVDVRALVLPGEGVDHIESFITEIARGNITSPLSLRGSADDVDIVFHLAARVVDWGTREDFYSSILDGTKNLLEECTGRTSRYVQVSSIAACGLGEHMTGRKEDEATNKSGVPYNDAKADAEKLVMSYHGRSGLSCTIVRPANVTGAGSVWVKDVLERFKKGPVPLIDGGQNSASLIHVDNLVDGIIRAGTMDVASGRIYHLRDDWEVTWNQYLTDLSAMIGKKPSFNISFNLAWTLGRYLEKICTPLGIRPPVTRLAAGVMGRDLDVDASRAREELGWSTRVSYEEAMVEIREYVLNNLVD